MRPTFEQDEAHGALYPSIVTYIRVTAGLAANCAAVFTENGRGRRYVTIAPLLAAADTVLISVDPSRILHTLSDPELFVTVNVVR